MTNMVIYGKYPLANFHSLLLKPCPWRVSPAFWSDVWSPGAGSGPASRWPDSQNARICDFILPPRVAGCVNKGTRAENVMEDPFRNMDDLGVSLMTLETSISWIGKRNFSWATSFVLEITCPRSENGCNLLYKYISMESNNLCSWGFHQYFIRISWLVGGWPNRLKNTSSSIGMIIPFPTEWENKIHVSNQPDNYH